MARFAATLPIGSLSSRDPEVSVSNEHWKKIESAYGHTVPKTARKQIFEATWNFLFFAEAEPIARPVSEARKRIEYIKKLLRRFKRQYLIRRTLRGTPEFMPITWLNDILTTYALRPLNDCA